MKANLDSFGIISLTTSDDVLTEDAARDKVSKSYNRNINYDYLSLLPPSLPPLLVTLPD